MGRIELHDNVIIPQHFGSLLYSRARHEYIPYDHLTTQVLYSSLDTSLFNLPPDVERQISKEQKKAFFKLGKKLNFIDREGRFIGRAIQKTPPQGQLLGPLTVHLSITQDCDLSCLHCFAAPEMKSEDRSLLTDPELDKLFDEVAELGCMRMAITGGEPLNRPDIFSIIDRINDRGIDVCLTTNGLRIDREVAREFAKRSFAWVNVSLEGVTPETNDAIRGKGVYDKVVSNLKKHFKWRLPFGLSITLNKLNRHEIPLFPKLAREVGAEIVMMRGMYFIGSGLESMDLCLSFEEYQEALSDLNKSNDGINIVPTSCEPAGLDDELAVIYQNFGCAAGNTVATIYHNGDVSPCSLIGEGIELDNLREKSFTDIWRSGNGFKKIRALQPSESCGTCDSYESCSGGCRARAWVAHKDIESPDPWCKKLPNSIVFS